MLSKSLLKGKALTYSIKGLNVPSIKNFSSSHSASGSDSDDHHHDHGHHEERSFYDDKKMSLPMNTLDHVKSEVFDPLALLQKLREPIKAKKPSNIINRGEFAKTVTQIENEYAEFLASAFENVVSKKYPEYKAHVNEFKHLIPNYDSLNPYEREVKTLDAYMHWTVNQLRQKSFEAENVTQTEKLDQAKARAEFFNKVTLIEEGDSHIMKNLKKKLQKVIDSEVKYQQFKFDYKKELESKALERIVDEKKLAYSKLDDSNNKVLNDLKSSLNPNYHTVSITPHDHIDIANWHKNPQQLENEKHKYLAMYDLVIDQHLRRVRPDQMEDDILKYVKPNHKPLEVFYDKYADNTVFDYICRNDGEFFIKYRQEIEKMFDKKEVEDPNRPCDRHWKDEYKFPHVADRLGWAELGEYPFDKNPFFERINSVPLFQWQPFTQTPSLNPDVNLDLEEGEVLYEDKWAFEWSLFWKLMALVGPIMMYILMIQVYENNTFPSHRLKARWTFSGMFPGLNHQNYIESKKVENLVYWGKDLWYWQHWVKKMLIYPAFIVVGINHAILLKFMGNWVVLKATFNRSKDLLFITKPHFFGKEMVATELHHLEKPLSSVVHTWKYYSYINGNKDGYHPIIDTRTTQLYFFKEHPNYWNADLRQYFDNNTSSYWKGLRSREVNKGIFFNNSLHANAEELEWERELSGELKEAIKKHGPIQKTDYEHNFTYQLKKRLNESRMSLVNV